ncbi:MAG: glycosyltransferase, partial [Egibacteraceae bacterium]
MPTVEAPRDPGVRRGTKVAYTMSRFPKISETFVLYELLAVEREGVTVELYPLLRERVDLMHPEAVPLMERAHFQPFLSGAILRSQLHFLRHHPRRYLTTLFGLLKGTWGSLNFFVGGIGIFPKVAHMARLMAADGVRHVHCHFATHPALAGWVVHRLVGIPYSFTAHGSDLHVDRHMLPQKVAQAAFVVTISEDNREVIVRTCGEWARERVHVVQCGVEVDELAPASGARRGEHFAVLCIGTLHEVKGQRYLLEACRLLADAGIDVACTIVGEGPDRAALEAWIDRQRLASCVTLAGQRSRREVAAFLAAADVVAVPSVPTPSGKREGIPVVLMEAMSSGVPVVASGISGIPEIVEHERTGLLVPPGDAAALAAALRRLHDDASLRKRLAAAGRDKVVRDFNLRTGAAHLARLFAGRTSGPLETEARRWAPADR